MWTHFHEFQLSHEGVSEVSERARERSERVKRSGALRSKWAVRANKRSERPSGPLKTRLSRLETGPYTTSTDFPSKKKSHFFFLMTSTALTLLGWFTEVLLNICYYLSEELMWLMTFDWLHLKVNERLNVYVSKWIKEWMNKRCHVAHFFVSSYSEWMKERMNG